MINHVLKAPIYYWGGASLIITWPHSKHGVSNWWVKLFIFVIVFSFIWRLRVFWRSRR